MKLMFWFLNWSVKKGYTNSDYKNVKIDLKKSQHKVIYLDMEEVTKIFKADIPESKEYIHRTRDIFIFQCLTGLRFSDMHNLKVSDIKTILYL